MTQKQADEAEVCQDRIALEQYQEGIVDLGKREILDIGGRLLVRAEKAEAALAEKSKECEALKAIYARECEANKTGELVFQIAKLRAELAAQAEQIGKAREAANVADWEVRKQTEAYQSAFAQAERGFYLCQLALRASEVVFDDPGDAVRWGEAVNDYAALTPRPDGQEK